MRAIPLIRFSDGAVVARTWIDDEDFEFLSQWTWKKDRGGYSVRGRGSGNLRRNVLMHRVIAERAGMNMSKTIDHISRNKLDNRRSNLRPATRQQQNCNQGIRTNNTSGATGVDWHKSKQKWRVRIKLDGKSKHLGYFDDLEDAKRARRAAEVKYHEEFAPNQEIT
jgi:hypothetical protein